MALSLCANSIAKPVLSHKTKLFNLQRLEIIVIESKADGTAGMAVSGIPASPVTRAAVGGNARLPFQGKEPTATLL